MGLLEPRIEPLAPEPAAPSPDAAPAWVAGGSPPQLRAELAALVGVDRGGEFGAQLRRAATGDPGGGGVGARRGRLRRQRLDPRLEQTH